MEAARFCMLASLAVLFFDGAAGLPPFPSFSEMIDFTKGTRGAPDPRRIATPGPAATPEPKIHSPGSKLVISGWRASGTPLFNVPKLSVVGCISKCQKTSGCVSTTWNPDVSCQGFSSASDLGLATDHAWTVMTAWNRNSPIQRLSGKDLPADDLKFNNHFAVQAGDTDFSKPWNEDLCAQLCEIHPQCNSGTLSSTGCRLKEKKDFTGAPCKESSCKSFYWG